MLCCTIQKTWTVLLITYHMYRENYKIRGCMILHRNTHTLTHESKFMIKSPKS